MSSDKPAEARSADKKVADFGAFIPSTAEPIGMTSPRPAALSLGADFRNVQPPPKPAAAPRVQRSEPGAPPSARSEAPPASTNAQFDGSDAAIDTTHDPVAAAQSALGALAMGLAGPAPASVIPAPQQTSATALQPLAVQVEAVNGRKTLDDSIVDMLRPMLREWLDAHLPEMVEKALRVELNEHPRLKQ